MRPLAAMVRAPRALLDAATCARAADEISAALGLVVDLAISDRPAQIRDLSPRERQALGDLRTESRIRSWLRGRAALKALLGQLGNSDTSRIEFPHPRYSLTHTRDLAVAAASRSNTAGVGIDLEFLRPAPASAARFYLTSDEQDFVTRLRPHEREAALIRLWTVKEALFKADPQNENTVLSDYELEAAGAWTGRCTVPADLDLRYMTIPVPDGFLTVATATRR